jgi:hypothetical protein
MSQAQRLASELGACRLRTPQAVARKQRTLHPATKSPSFSGSARLHQTQARNDSGHLRGEHDRNRRGGTLHRENWRGRRGDDDVDLAVRQLGRNLVVAFVPRLRPTIIDYSAQPSSPSLLTNAPTHGLAISGNVDRARACQHDTGPRLPRQTRVASGHPSRKAG